MRLVLNSVAPSAFTRCSGRLRQRPNSAPRIIRATAVAFGCMLVVACVATNRVAEDQLPQLSTSMKTFAKLGPAAYSKQDGEHRGVHGCLVRFETYRPDSTYSDLMAFLAHGFMRDLETVRGWAIHWASHRVPVTVMSLCNSSWFAGRHDRDADDMVGVGRALHEGPVLYAGFSAGGLVAYLAAARDSRSTAYLGLDSVDHKNLVSDVSTPSFQGLMLVAEPSACNARNNILRSISAAPNIDVLRIRNTTHCHYEYPWDSRCASVCGSVEPKEAREILLMSVRAQATRWMLEQTRKADRSVD